MTVASHSLASSVAALSSAHDWREFPHSVPMKRADEREAMTPTAMASSLAIDRPGSGPCEAAVRVAEEMGWLGAFSQLRALDDTPPEAPGRHTTFPIAVKDVIDVEGYRTLNGVDSGEPPVRMDSVVYARLRRAGAELVGKTTTHALALGATTPGCLNPIDTTRMAGGSSGGSAAAVAAGIVPVALGTDTGGSIRVPAALCGVLGLKPTLHSVPTTGVSPLAPSQDVVGVIGTSAMEVRRAFDIMRGTATLSSSRPLSLGTIDERWVTAGEALTGPVVERALADAARGGGTVRPIKLPLSRLASAASYVVMLSEAAYSWPRQRFGTHLGQVPVDVSELLGLGERITAVQYVNARSLSHRIRRELLSTMEAAGIELVVLPASPIAAPQVGVKTVELDGREVPVEAALGRFAALASITGLPAVSVPAGISPDGLPLGVQLIGTAHSEGRLLDAAARIEVGAGAAEVRTALALASARNRRSGSTFSDPQR